MRIFIEDEDENEYRKTWNQIYRKNNLKNRVVNIFIFGNLQLLNIRSNYLF